MHQLLLLLSSSFGLATISHHFRIWLGTSHELRIKICGEKKKIIVDKVFTPPKVIQTPFFVSFSYLFKGVL